MIDVQNGLSLSLVRKEIHDIFEIINATEEKIRKYKRTEK